MQRCKGGIGQKNDFDLFGSPIIRAFCYLSDSATFIGSVLRFVYDTVLFGYIRISLLICTHHALCDCHTQWAIVSGIAHALI